MNRRVVLDTHCIVSALLFSQLNLAWLRHSWQSEDFVALVNQQTVNELLRVLAYPKFQLTKEEQGLLLADFLPYAETVPLNDDPAEITGLRDPADQKFLSLAINARADALVSGDKDILVLKNSVTQPLILSLPEFEQWLKGKSHRMCRGTRRIL
jgi:putative PIN family toxin of toxin-antitoxin system